MQKQAVISDLEKMGVCGEENKTKSWLLYIVLELYIGWFNEFNSVSYIDCMTFNQ